MDECGLRRSECRSTCFIAIAPVVGGIWVQRLRHSRALRCRTSFGGRPALRRPMSRLRALADDFALAAGRRCHTNLPAGRTKFTFPSARSTLRRNSRHNSTCIAVNNCRGWKSRTVCRDSLIAVSERNNRKTIEPAMARAGFTRKDPRWAQEYSC